MPHNRITIRNFDAGSLLEIFMVSAVAAVLGIRFFLQGFTFFKEEFSADWGLFFNILILWALHFIIKREEVETAKNETLNTK